MRRALLLGTRFLTVAGWTVLTAAQGGLPDAAHTLIVGARSFEQAHTQALLRITLQSGDRITVAPSDVHQQATFLLRSALREQAHQPVAPSRLFVLQVAEKAREVQRGRAFVNITLLSGAKFRLRAEDVEDARLTFLHTALEQARWPPPPKSVEESAALASSCGPKEAPPISFDAKGANFQQWLPRFVAQVRRNWWIPMAATTAMTQQGQVVVTFTVRKDGRLIDVSVKEPSPVEAFNLSARKALLDSNPTLPLPPDYPSESAFFTVTFYYCGGSAQK